MLAPRTLLGLRLGLHLGYRLGLHLGVRFDVRRELFAILGQRRLNVWPPRLLVRHRAHGDLGLAREAVLIVGRRLARARVAVHGDRLAAGGHTRGLQLLHRGPADRRLGARLAPLCLGLFREQPPLDGVRQVVVEPQVELRAARADYGLPLALGLIPARALDAHSRGPLFGDAPRVLVQLLRAEAGHRAAQQRVHLWPHPRHFGVLALSLGLFRRQPPLDGLCQHIEAPQRDLPLLVHDLRAPLALALVPAHAADALRVGHLLGQPPRVLPQLLLIVHLNRLRQQVLVAILAGGRHHAPLPLTKGPGKGGRTRAALLPALERARPPARRADTPTCLAEEAYTPAKDSPTHCTPRPPAP
mmetsp:Transcript_10507/g.32726  ORF Transcript_10507/g.32726 Transcript_10507/m.32726 type:complete len:358 (+) Transcript_10507:541-1614(+)